MITINPATRVISVPQADLTFISGTLYEMDTEGYFRQGLMDIFDSEDYIWMPTAFTHNTESVIAGITYARTIAIINGYKIQFTPDSQWTVVLKNSNNDIWNVAGGILVQNQVQVIPTNSAGLIVTTGGAGASAAEVWDYVGGSAVDKEDDLIKARKAAELAAALSA